MLRLYYSKYHHVFWHFFTPGRNPLKDFSQSAKGGRARSEVTSHPFWAQQSKHCQSLTVKHNSVSLVRHSGLQCWTLTFKCFSRVWVQPQNPKNKQVPQRCCENANVLAQMLRDLQPHIFHTFQDCTLSYLMTHNNRNELWFKVNPKHTHTCTYTQTHIHNWALLTQSINNIHHYKKECNT